MPPGDSLDQLINEALSGGGGGSSSGDGTVVGSGTINIGGVQYRQNPQTGQLERVSRGGDLTFAEQLQLRSTPSQSSSYNVSQSYADPRALALQERDMLLGYGIQERDLGLKEQGLAQDMEQFRAAQQQEWQQFVASQAQSHQQFMMGYDLELKSLAQQIAIADRDYALQQANFQFLQDKFNFESQMSLRAEARETEQMLFNQRTVLADLDMKRQSMIQQAEMVNMQARNEAARFNAQMKADADRFNQQMGFTVAQANEEAERLRQEQLQSLARDIGTMAQDPGDRGALASYILANQGGRFDDVTDEDFRTETSLTPLDMLLHQREEAVKPRTPFSFDPVVAEQMQAEIMPLPQFGALPEMTVGTQPVTPFTPQTYNLPAANLGGTFASNGAYYEPEEWQKAAMYPQTLTGKSFPAQAPDRSQITSLPVGGTYTTPDGYTYTNYGTSNGALSALSPDAYAQVPDWVKKATGAKYEEGGVAEEAIYKVGEGGPEFVIKLAPGIDYVVAKDKVTPKVWAQLEKATSRGMQTGGIIASSIFGENVPGTTLATPFLQEAVKRAKAGTPWEKGVLPGITSASTPGLDPIVQELLASLNSIERGVPMDYFMRQAQRAAPAGIASGPIRRTA